MPMRSAIRWLTLSLAVSCIAIVGYALTGYDVSQLQGRVLAPETQLDIPWRTFDPEEVASGSTIAPNTHTIFHLPADAGRVARKVLFGDTGDTVRYWGYCYPEGYDESEIAHIVGFPGKLFLSEAERADRQEQFNKRFRTFSIFQPPTKLETELKERTRMGVIRHQLEVFTAGMSCYVMSEAPLPIGTDLDEDMLNSMLEKMHRTDPENEDTDGDGLWDGPEVLIAKTDPLRRDTDSDGIIDGIEDVNHNGIRDSGETDPTNIDSDRDGLCDGYCRISKGGRVCSDFGKTIGCIPTISIKWRGEDKNLNGQLDANETDPLDIDTDGDGVFDEQEYFQCLLEKKTGC
ncbi:MAG: hypothetical protein Q7R81_07765 [Candidatus Peregrinibacteria bacterium]|nr:hypothetical protein [Candidatus Peregrinibacteria bacterium]